jgi:hypothetical protein
MFEAYRNAPPLETTAPLLAAALKLAKSGALPMFVYPQARWLSSPAPRANVIRFPTKRIQK